MKINNYNKTKRQYFDSILTSQMSAYLYDKKNFNDKMLKSVVGVRQWVRENKLRNAIPNAIPSDLSTRFYISRLERCSQSGFGFPLKLTPANQALYIRAHQKCQNIFH